MRTDSLLWMQSSLSQINLILSGFTVSGVGLQSATIAMSGASLIVPQNQFDFSYFVAAPSQANLTVTPTQLTAGVRNYVEVNLSTIDAVPLTKAFWDPNANSGAGSEFSQTVNTVTDLNVNIVTGTTGFSGSPNNLPIAIIDTDNTGVIKIILDRRSMFGRLAKPNNLANQYSWGAKQEPVYVMTMTSTSGTFVAGETINVGSETATVVSGGTSSITFQRPSGINFSAGGSVSGTTSSATGTIATIAESFTGVDKSLSGQKNINDAIMTEIMNMKGTVAWWSNANNSLNGLTNQHNSMMVQFTPGAKFAWSGTNLSITDNSGSPSSADVVANIRILGDSRGLNLSRQDGTGGSVTIPIADDGVLFVALPASGNRTYSGIGSGATNFQTVTRTSYVNSDTNYWMAFRQGSNIYIRGQGEMLAGESGGIGDTVPQTLLDNIGLADEVTPASYSSNIRGTQGQSIVARAGILTDAVGDEQEDRSGYLRSDNVVQWTGTQVVFTSDIILEFLNTKSGTLTQHTVATASSPITVNNGESVYVLINRTSTSETLTPVRSSIVPIPAQTSANKDVFVLFRRVDVSTQHYLHIPFHKQVLNPGQAVRLGASGSGSGGIFKVQNVDAISTTLPTGASVTTDGSVGVNGDLVLFTNLSSNNNAVYQLSGVGTSISWAIQNAFNNASAPTSADLVVAQNGTNYANVIGEFDGTIWSFNSKTRYFQGLNYLEQSGLQAQTLLDNQASPVQVFSVLATGSENWIIDYSILRNGLKETQTMWITHDGTNAFIANGGAFSSLVGISFSAAIVTGNLVLSYTSTSTGSNASMKYASRRWADATGGSGGIPSYSPSTVIVVDSVQLGSSLQIGGSNFLMNQASVNTTDATVTTLQTVGIPSNSAVLLEARVVGRRTGGSSGAAMDAMTAIVTARAKNVGGTVTLYNVTSNESADQAWVVDFVVSGASVLIKVTGAVNNNVSWKTTTLTQTI